MDKMTRNLLNGCDMEEVSHISNIIFQLSNKACSSNGNFFTACMMAIKAVIEVNVADMKISEEDVNNMKKDLAAVFQDLLLASEKDGLFLRTVSGKDAEYAAIQEAAKKHGFSSLYGKNGAKGEA